MKKFLSLIMALAMLLTPMCAVTAFAAGDEEEFSSSENMYYEANEVDARAREQLSTLSEKMRALNIYRIQINMAMGERNRFLDIICYDAAGNRVATPDERYLSKGDIMNEKATYFFLWSLQTINYNNVDTFAFTMFYDAGADDYIFPYLALRPMQGPIWELRPRPEEQCTFGLAFVYLLNLAEDRPEFFTNF